MNDVNEDFGSSNCSTVPTISLDSGDDHCRARTAVKIDEVIRDLGDLTVGEVAKQIGRSVRYVRSVVDDTFELKIETKGKRVSDWLIRTQCLTCGEWLGGPDDGSDQCSLHL